MPLIFLLPLASNLQYPVFPPRWIECLPWIGDDDSVIPVVTAGARLVHRRARFAEPHQKGSGIKILCNECVISLLVGRRVAQCDLQPPAHSTLPRDRRTCRKSAPLPSAASPGSRRCILCDRLARYVPRSAEHCDFKLNCGVHQRRRRL